MAILGTIPIQTAPSPLYNAKNPSFWTMLTPVEISPGGLLDLSAADFLNSCIRTLMVSRGWQQRASNRPAVPPATRSMAVFFGLLLFAAEALMLSQHFYPHGPPILYTWSLPYPQIFSRHIGEGPTEKWQLR
ncbi:hypothetical protein OGAPHI_003871 [Ogataea philodendri]|uniref:Uncharacterized protein n=1 Tax=Ogataea philodendri TaxID=1378263 RepID=A0A9P8P558_9ASCO|nr:uncharacterized protein OGAPHI_003871 [Ogataea philodendri]KAH3665683.1 hypothetical protein OGAPHI_003871 [Ogataea philodendri]